MMSLSARIEQLFQFYLADRLKGKIYQKKYYERQKRMLYWASEG